MSQPAPSPLPQPDPDSDPNPAILVIDDEPSVRNVTRTLLERAGYRVLTAASGAEGVEVYRAHAQTIRLVVLDLTMPKMSGRDVLRELERANQHVRVIFASGYSHPESMPDGPSVAGFLHKPFRFDDLLAAVRQATS